MKIAIGCDHGGINLKPVLIEFLEKKGVAKRYVDDVVVKQTRERMRGH